MRTNRVLRLALAIAAGGCVAAAQAPAGPTATLRLKSIGHGWFNPNTNGFDGFDNDHCRANGDPSLTGSWFRLGLGRTIQPVQVTAEKRLFIRAIARTGTYETNALKLETCTNLVSFVPEAGHTYDIAQSATGRQCFTSIEDAATGATPTSFHTEMLHWTCKPE